MKRTASKCAGRQAAYLRAHAPTARARRARVTPRCGRRRRPPAPRPPPPPQAAQAAQAAGTPPASERARAAGRTSSRCRTSPRPLRQSAAGRRADSRAAAAPTPARGSRWGRGRGCTGSTARQLAAAARLGRRSRTSSMRGAPRRAPPVRARWGRACCPRPRRCAADVPVAAR
eukprot:2483572-Prymnesium_polylepis.2